MHPWLRRGPRRAIVAACVALAAPASAQAADGVIDGSPLNVYANDVGRLQAGFDGVASGEFYTGALMPNDGGISVAVQAVGANAFTVYGRAGGRTLTPVSAPVVTGNGSAGTPWRLTTAFRATDPATGGDLLDVSEVLEYVNGTGDVTVTYTLSAPTLLSNVRLYHSASVLPASSYLATGFLQPGPPRRVGAQALGRDSGGSDSLIEVTPWSAFQEATAVGLPACYVPLPIGNGEQRFNAAPVVEAGGALMVDNAECTPEWVKQSVVPLLRDDRKLTEMGRAAEAFGIRDGDERLAAIVERAARKGVAA